MSRRDRVTVEQPFAVVELTSRKTEGNGIVNEQFCQPAVAEIGAEERREFTVPTTATARTWEIEQRELTAATREQTVVEVIGGHVHQPSILLETPEATWNSRTGPRYTGLTKPLSLHLSRVVVVLQRIKVQFAQTAFQRMQSSRSVVEDQRSQLQL